MAQTALPAPRTPARRRAFFGLFDANGWGWASTKALFWFVVIIVMLGYIPDRAYYLTVGRTVEIWPFAQFLHWSPVNLCPAENNLSVCPVPPGATLPWEIAPAELKLPEGRTDGGAAIVGTRTFYVGGTDGTAASDKVFVTTNAKGNVSKWEVGPALPDPRTDIAVLAVGNTLHAFGGTDASGAPTTTAWKLTINTDGSIGSWEVDDALTLPEARTGAAAISLSDGIMLAGGSSAAGPVNSAWKSTADAKGVLAAWKPENPLFEATTDALGVHVGDYVYVIGGRNANGASGGVQVLDTAPMAEGAEAPRWAVNNALNLPAPRANLTGFTVNGVVYVIGGTDGTNLSSEVLWTVPNADGTHPGWKHLMETDLGSGLQGSAAVASGSNAFVIGGTAPAGITGDLGRANLAPQDPFFQAGILGATIPGLRLEGEIGQQLGYLNAATVGAVNFIILILIGVAYNQPEKVRAIREKLKARRGR